jgi:DNA (cytosine-5)-methyltransferase 1
METNIEKIIRNKRETLGLTQREFAELLGLKDTSERTVSGWERGEHCPNATKLSEIINLKTEVPFKNKRKINSFSFIDVFAGIGGLRIPFQELGGECVFSSEWDKFAKKTYAANFAELPRGDITSIHTNDIPNHDILLAGFPCQPFSQAGLRKGFLDTRGTLFFEIQRILSDKRPKILLLENVKQLRGHDKGKTLETILSILRGENAAEIPENAPISGGTREGLSNKLNYCVDYRVLRANDFGVPQKRERIYILGFDRNQFPGVNLDSILSNIFSELESVKMDTRLGDILEDNNEVSPKFTISDRLLLGHKRRKKEHKKKGNGFGYSVFNKESPYCNTISARYYKDGSEILVDQDDLGKNPRKLTPRECARIQGFPEKFIVDSVSNVQIYKQFGNSVSVPVIRAIAKRAIRTLKCLRKK